MPDPTAQQRAERLAKEVGTDLLSFSNSARSGLCIRLFGENWMGRKVVTSIERLIAERDALRARVAELEKNQVRVRVERPEFHGFDPREWH